MDNQQNKPNKTGRFKKNKASFIIGIVMILCVIGLMIARQYLGDNPLLLFAAVLVVVIGFTAAIVISSVNAAKHRREMGEQPVKKSASDIVMYISSGIGGVALLALLWSMIFSEKVNYPVVFAELVVFIAGFSVTYNIFMKKKKPSLDENDNEGEQ